MGQISIKNNFYFLSVFYQKKGRSVVWVTGFFEYFGKFDFFCRNNWAMNQASSSVLLMKKKKGKVFRACILSRKISMLQIYAYYVQANIIWFSSPSGICNLVPLSH